MKKFMCPYCFDKHSIEDCKVVCTTRTCPKGYKDELGNVDPETIDYCLKRCRNAGMNASCPSTDVMTKYEQFVRNYSLDAGTGFKLNIPREIRKGEKTFTIAVVGGPFSGKSNYLAVLINQLNTVFGRNFRSTLSFLNDATNEVYTQRYYNPIYERNRVPEKTLAGETIPPLMYKLKIASPLIGFIKRKVNFAFYDVAGEDLGGQGKMQEKGYIANADLIIVLLDPNQMKNLDVGNSNYVSPTTMLTNIANLINGQRNISFGKIRTPIALAMSKVDKLASLDVFDNGDDPVLHESKHLAGRGFSKNDFNSTSTTMNTVFRRLADPNPVQFLEDNFSNYALFGVSALGDDPRGTDIEKLNTYRVLDPIIWFLHKKGYIKTLPENRV